ncbi:MAG TPA: helix-turn-helix transcriptional regulator [Acidimicrobiales bacterium]|nr:helix-turn-helix transcriptional regulator [Acidimicrobiales bacterium]
MVKRFEQPPHRVEVSVISLADMDFAHRLVAIRKERNLTQQVLADRVGIHVSNVRRYEAGTSQPTLDVLRNLALALNISADSLLFEPDERGPEDPGLRLRLEALDQLDPEELAGVRALIEGALLRHQARQLAG